MRFKLPLSIALLACSQLSFAIVLRHDVSADHYEAAEAPAYLVDMPHEGHGALIAPNWIVTVAHVIFYDCTGKKITIGNEEYQIEKVIKHDNSRSPDETLTRGDAKPLMDFMKTTSDIALIKLSSNVEGITPISLYPDNDEAGQIITAFGRGSTGDGLTGSVYSTKKQRVLRTMNNKVDSAEGGWLSIIFDNGPESLDLEGIDGSGDSGGPLVIYKDGVPYLAGLFSWDYVEGALASFQPGLYGNKSYQVRISSYRKWIGDSIENN